MPLSRRRPLMLIAIASPLLLGAVGWWWRSRTAPERHLAEALRLLDTDAPGEAEAWLPLPESDPSTRDRAMIGRARLALARQRPEQAIAPLDAVSADGASSIDAAYWKGRTLIALKSAKLAIAWFHRVLEQRPDDLEARRWLAAASYDLGDWPAAVNAIEGLLRRKPDDARAWRTLGALFKEEGELARSVDAYRTTLRHDGRQFEARFELAQVLLKLGRYDEAKQELDQCRGHVAEADRLDLLVQCLRARGERDEAKALLDKALPVFPGHHGLLAQAALLDQADGDYARALDSFNQALEVEPDNPQYLYQRGRLLRLLDRGEESERDLARASSLNRDMARMAELNSKAIEHPDDPEVRCRLGELCVRLCMPELAGYWYRAALACDPDSKAAREGLQGLRLR
ncbi:tetratricopeptide repeat protein [Singulisphaera sp. PoT]|uniref:tetratricopeptide repeat protein n=1 Tax=Singulisphaera sp. PoT TaxID=3411797 RepID=UPI003BF56EC8